MRESQNTQTETHTEMHTGNAIAGGTFDGRRRRSAKIVGHAIVRASGAPDQAPEQRSEGQVARSTTEGIQIPSQSSND